MKKIKSKLYKKIVIFSLTSMLFSLNGCKDNHEDNTLSISFENMTNEDETNNIEYEFLDSTSELEKYFPGNVTFDTVRQSLESNTNITDEYREYTNEFIDLVEQKFPNINLTIFNENIKIFSVNEITKAEMKKEKNREAYYDISNVTIGMHDEHINSNRKKYCYFHELWHMFNNLCLEVNGTIFYKTPTLYELEGTAFDEGMNTFLTEQIIDVGISSYIRQYDQIRILYEIYGDELLYTYLDSGIEGVEIYLAKDIGYGDTLGLIQNMNTELEGKNTNPIPIFNTLINLYLNSDNESTIKTQKIINILENLVYDRKIKEEILLNFDTIIGIAEVPDNALVSFDNETFYKISDLYFVECNGTKYIVNDAIVIDFFNKGVLRNVFEENGIYYGDLKIKVGITLQEYIRYDESIYNYDQNNNIVYIDEKEIKGGSYVKSK